MTTPHQELRQLITGRLELGLSPEETADAIMRLFADVKDEWDQIDISTFGEGPGGRVIDQRTLVCRIPRESRERTADRTAR